MQHKMKLIHFIVFSLKLLFTLAEGPQMLLSTAIRINKIVVSYPIGVISERDLTVCQQSSACNIIHKRFWLPPLIERLCRCPCRNECPWTFSAAGDNQTVYLNNRSQLKFCTDLSHLPYCTTKKPAITISTLPLTRSERQLKNNVAAQVNKKSRRYTEARNVTILCNCQEPHYWKLKNNSMQLTSGNNHTQKTYYCSKLKKCQRTEFCGYVRLDTHSTFYKCSCPRGHLCITRDKTVDHAEEMLYSGDSYKAYCLPVFSGSRKKYATS